MPFTVALVDDDSGFREALQWLLTSSGYDVRSYESLGLFVHGHDPTLVGCSLIDLRLGEDNGIEALKAARMQGHDAPALIISAYGDIPTAVLAVQLGAHGFLEKPTDNDKLLTAVAEACGRHVAIRRTYGMAIDAIRKYQRLTEREADVYWLLVGGAATKEFAARLHISTRTAETHRGRVFEKMEAAGLDDLVLSSFHIKLLFGPSEGVV
ncbi:DNA-binding response regulator [Paramagnetospirillum kuznetsovii]|uniref:DNA-binding response regulator n=1 Tax=Paramagnetospirillum kuznetsovii TaxID=2053833 RepID=A0A364NVR5_9PROT|nr:response regulator [Paramagnetospirillum kuznetsovii]RAU21152.1 DNA-binding response regulator [Paramagnetospirillum kuznetsovii]